MDAAILVFDGADELDVVGPYRVLAAAGIAVRLVAATAGEVALGNRLRVRPDATFDGCPPVDILVVPGGSSDHPTSGRRTAQRDEAVLGFVRRRAGEARLVASVCTGAFVLASAGLLTGRRVSTHWAFRAELRDLMAARDETVEVVPERVVWDGDLVTSGGVTSGIDLALSIVERELGEDARDRVAAQLERETPPVSIDSVAGSTAPQSSQTGS